ncbi:MAG: hypothetical protein ACOYLQ_20180 [Hyphomicrobiaceae bacterium]
MSKPEDYRRQLVPTRRAIVRQGLCLPLLVAGLVSDPFGAPAQAPSGTTREWPLRSADGLKFNLVEAVAGRFKDRDAVAVELTADAQKSLLVPGAAGNGPSFAMPDIEFANGAIEVDLAARINGKGQPEVRGFIGLAFHIADDLGTFEAVYLRMTNGSRNTPPPPAPRNVFAVQYISFPDRYWRKLRQEHPNKYEQPAPVAIETWHKLRVEISGSIARVFVDGEAVLTVDDVRFPDRKGRIGLWVDDGTAGYFANLRVTTR